MDLHSRNEKPLSINDILIAAKKSLSANTPELLTAGGVAGVLATAYLTGKASYHAGHIIRADEDVSGTADTPVKRFRERGERVWKLYIPAGVCGVATIGCILGSHKANSKRTAAAFTAYSLAEAGFNEYRDKVVEQLGEGKEQKIRDEINHDRVKKLGDPGSVVIVGSGHVLCCELYTGRFFRCDVDTIKKALNTINHDIVHQMYVSLDDLYHILGLESTTDSSNLGWDSDKLLDLEISYVAGPNDEPCIAFAYNYVKPLR